jgi:membrane protein implicated in regulation of membrane protease activity
VNPYVKYTMARLGLFVAAAALVWFLPLDPLVRLMIALVISAVASLFLLRRMRDDVSVHVSGSVDRRRDSRERLRRALAGEDGEDATADPREEKEPREEKG